MADELHVKGPVGWIRIVEDAGRIVEVDYVKGEVDADSLTLETSRPVLKQCARELDEYFRGVRREFDVPVDLASRGTPFQQKVWKRLYDIPYGESISYKELANDCGGPNHSRAVANANGKNPISIIVPCHRVISSDGRLGGYTGGIDKKEMLLGLEGVEVRG